MSMIDTIEKKPTNGLTLGKEAVFKQFLESAITAQELEDYIKNDLALAKERRLNEFKDAVEGEKERVLASLATTDLDDVKYNDKITGLKVLNSISRLENGESSGNIEIKWSD